MVTRDLAALRALLDRLPRPPIAGVELACKHFFSGAAGYANGRIFMSLTPVGLALKLPEETRAALIDRGAEALRYFPKGPIKKHYVCIPNKLADDQAALAAWIVESIRYSQTFPKPRSPKKGARGAS